MHYLLKTKRGGGLRGEGKDVKDKLLQFDAVERGRLSDSLAQLIHIRYAFLGHMMLQFALVLSIVRKKN
jgi:hypothetical protein